MKSPAGDRGGRARGRRAWLCGPCRSGANKGWSTLKTAEQGPPGPAQLEWGWSAGSWGYSRKLSQYRLSHPWPRPFNATPPTLAPSGLAHRDMGTGELLVPPTQLGQGLRAPSRTLLEGESWGDSQKPQRKQQPPHPAQPTVAKAPSACTSRPTPSLQAAHATGLRRPKVEGLLPQGKSPNIKETADGPQVPSHSKGASPKPSPRPPDGVRQQI